MEFSDVFEKPSGLPPSRGHEDKINLELDAVPICARPYKYPFFQMNEIERHVQVMLDSGVIRTIKVLLLLKLSW